MTGFNYFYNGINLIFNYLDKNETSALQDSFLFKIATRNDEYQIYDYLFKKWYLINILSNDNDDEYVFIYKGLKIKLTTILTIGSFGEGPNFIINALCGKLKSIDSIQFKFFKSILTLIPDMFVLDLSLVTLSSRKLVIDDPDIADHILNSISNNHFKQKYRSFTAFTTHCIRNDLSNISQFRNVSIYLNHQNMI